ncbi:MAG: hypothetical protein ACMXYL_02375 [Candidatus Woesearchaeota archaeon]
MRIIIICILILFLASCTNQLSAAEIALRVLEAEKDIVTYEGFGIVESNTSMSMHGMDMTMRMYGNTTVKVNRDTDRYLYITNLNAPALFGGMTVQSGVYVDSDTVYTLNQYFGWMKVGDSSLYDLEHEMSLESIVSIIDISTVRLKSSNMNEYILEFKIDVNELFGLMSDDIFEANMFDELGMEWDYNVTMVIDRRTYHVKEYIMSISLNADMEEDMSMSIDLYQNLKIFNINGVVDIKAPFDDYLDPLSGTMPSQHVPERMPLTGMAINHMRNI